MRFQLTVLCTLLLLTVSSVNISKAQQTPFVTQTTTVNQSNNDLTLLYLYSEAFSDSLINGPLQLEQVNGQNDTALKLSTLAQSLLNIDIDISTNSATYSVFPGNYAGISVSNIYYQDGQSFPAGQPINLNKPVTVSDVALGEQITFNLLNAFGVIEHSIIKSISDTLPPTLIVQDNLGLDELPNYPSNIFISGNENFPPVLGPQIIYVQPKLFESLQTLGGDTYLIPDTAFDSIINLSNQADDWNQNNQLTQSTKLFFRPTYDQQSWLNNSWTANVTMRAAFSEDIVLTGLQPIIENSIGTTLLEARNNLQNDLTAHSYDYELGYTQDVVLFDVLDIYQLSRFDQTEMNFGQVVKDSSNNVISNNLNSSSIIFKDALPPMVILASWNGLHLKVVFNEEIAITQSSVLTIVNPESGTKSSIGIYDTIAHQPNGDGTHAYTIEAYTIGEFFPSWGWDYVEPSYDQNRRLNHAILRWDSIEDLNGNKWDTYTAYSADENGQWGGGEKYQLNAPQFLVYSSLGNFTASFSGEHYLEGEDKLALITINYSHPITNDITDFITNLQFDLNANDFLDANENFDINTDEISLSDDKQTLTILIKRPKTDYNNNWSVKVSSAIQSALNSEQIWSGNFIVPFQDTDNDGNTLAFDNCPTIANPDQLNTDNADDGGNACDLDDDNDLIPDTDEIALGLDPLDASDALADSDDDGVNNYQEYLAGTPIFVAGCGEAYSYNCNEYQIVTSERENVFVDAQQEFSLTVAYKTSDTNPATTGIGIRVHYNSTQLEWLGFTNQLSTGLIEEASSALADTSNYDNNDQTDSYVNIRWHDATRSWPSANGALLFDVLFKSLTNVGSVVNFTSYSLSDTQVRARHYDYLFQSNSVEVFNVNFNLDINGDGNISALSDGILILRYLFDFRGDALIDKKITANSTRTTSADIENYLNSAVSHGLLDIDRDGNTSALRDGILILRYLFDFRNDALTSKKIGNAAQRDTNDEIEQYLKDLHFIH